MPGFESGKEILGRFPAFAQDHRPRTQDTSAQPPCPRCHDRGWVLPVEAITSPVFISPVRCSCKPPVRRQKPYSERYEQSNIKPYAHMRFDTYEATTPALQQAYEGCQAYAQNPRGFLLLSGEPGRGKTHLGAAVAIELLEGGYEVLFYNFPALLNALRATFEAQAQETFQTLLDRVCTVPVLVLDDMGAHKFSEWTEEQTYTIVDRRYTDQLPTIITTNSELSRLHKRIYSRIRDVNYAQHITITHTLDQRQVKRTRRSGGEHGR